MATIRRFEDIQAWQKARELVQEIYKISSVGRFGKDYGLRDQIQRAAVSAMSNIAEGFARKSRKDFSHFLSFARASAVEVQSLLYVALDTKGMDRSQFDMLYQKSEEVISMTTRLMAYLNKKELPLR
jgi:four helix bundle protein